MDPNKDYYAILGVHPTAEKAVIEAAYKALAKRYHPDMNRDNSDEAKRRMQEINEAYSILSDSNKRKEYDKAKGEGAQQGEDYFRGQEESEPDYDPLEENWEIALEYYPDLDEYYKNLKKISWKLGYGYKAYILENKDYKKRENIALKMEKDFLERYFGNNDNIKIYAKNLILLKELEASKELNKIVNVLGLNKRTEIEEIYKIKNKINKKYNLIFSEEKKFNDNKNNNLKCIQCEKNFRSIDNMFCSDECKKNFHAPGYIIMIAGGVVLFLFLLFLSIVST